jgi:formylglycine-generating enzyme required for sulfatase activity
MTYAAEHPPVAKVGLADPGSASLAITVLVSTDGGASYTLHAASFSGSGWGNAVAPGSNKQITWNAGADWNGQYSANVRFHVIADDAVAPSGMALIPAGSFTMGDSLDADTNALPLHTVYVSAFYTDKYDVTLTLWNSVYQWATNHGYNFDYAGSGKAANHPVQSVDWYDAVKWCNARSEMAGLTPAYYTNTAQTVVYRTGDIDIDIRNACVNWYAGYRLPTEAEWEEAARGGASGQRFPWGNTMSWSQANYYADPYDYAYDVNPTSGFDPTFNDGVYPYTSPVGYFAANGYGLYDMAGNVWQWCWDWYGSYSSGSQTDPRGPASGSARVNRGGSWNDGALACRSAFRSHAGPAYSDYRFGFRSVLPHIGLPVITVQLPYQCHIYPGDRVTFRVAAIGDAPLNYQWQENGTNIVSATGTSLTLTNVQEGIYHISVEVSNGVGSITSQTTELDVTGGTIGEH